MSLNIQDQPDGLYIKHQGSLIKIDYFTWHQDGLLAAPQECVITEIDGDYVLSALPVDTNRVVLDLQDLGE